MQQKFGSEVLIDLSDSTLFYRLGFLQNEIFSTYIY
jgi:hypothetical protein